MQYGREATCTNIYSWWR